MPAPLVIIGAGLAGWTVAREFRKLDTDTPVMLVTADSGDFYAKPSLSNAFAQRRTPDQLISTPAAAMAEKLNVQLLPGTRVEAIRPDSGTLVADVEIGYDKLVLATGARPLRAVISGDASDQVVSVNSLEDFRVFHERLERCGELPGREILIMGAGLIGCEFANDLIAAGHRVSVVDPAEQPLAALLPADAGRVLQDALAAKGVAWHLGATVAALDDSGDGGAGSRRHMTATLSDGTRIAADVVLSAIGLKPELGLAVDAGLACERGVLVDHYLRTSAPGIFALGDCAQYARGDWASFDARPSGGSLLPYVMPIMNAARVLARTLAGEATRLTFPMMPVTVKTPALPLVIAHPGRNVEGCWIAGEPGVWQFLCGEGRRRGFALAGAQLSRKAEMSASCYAGEE